ncbi:hypothetical protein AB0I60_22680 [Actinosynnema sp. NPDC050436]|uniref:hypothetical protein n=1 Tax=Actinosynnema sp. NPDC050436 TaxID=3155659 RepID=UPI00340192DB
MSSNLERRYRSLLRVLPGWYRAEREEEMVGLFLTDRDDDLDREHGWPGWDEAFATVGLAVRVRFRERSPAGDAARLVALVGLAGHVVLAAQGVATAVRYGGSPAVWFDALAVGAFAAVVTGRWAWARWLALVSAVVAVGSAVLAPGVSSWWAVQSALPAVVTAVAVWLGFHREAPAVPRARRWVAVSAVGAVLGAAVAWVFALSLVVWAAAWLITTAVVVVSRPWAGAPAGRSAPAG